MAAKASHKLSPGWGGWAGWLNYLGLFSIQTLEFCYQGFKILLERKSQTWAAWHAQKHTWNQHSLPQFPCFKKKNNCPDITGTSFLSREISCIFIPFQLHWIKTKICSPNCWQAKGRNRTSSMEVLSQGLSYHPTSGPFAEGVLQAETSKAWEFCSMESALPAARRLHGDTFHALELWMRP